MTDRLEPKRELQGFWRFASEHPDRTAIVEVDGSTLSFGQLRCRVNQISNGLRGLGVIPGQSVAAITRNGGISLRSRWQRPRLASASLPSTAIWRPLKSHISWETPVPSSSLSIDIRQDP